MAKCKFGMMMTDARGKLGGHVFTKNRAGAIIRTKVTPSNARTERQMFIRNALSTISANWSPLTQSQRDGFDGAVEQWQGTNIFGDIVNPTGKTLFTKLNLNLVNSEQAQITAVPVKAVLPNFLVTSVEYDGGDISANVLGNAVGFKIVISATAPQSQGTSFYKGKYRQIGVITGSSDVKLNLEALYGAKFGLPASTDNISFQFIVVLASGQASIPVTSKMTVV